MDFGHAFHGLLGVHLFVLLAGGVTRVGSCRPIFVALLRKRMNLSLKARKVSDMKHIV